MSFATDVVMTLTRRSLTGNEQRTKLEMDVMREEIALLRGKDEEKAGVIAYLEREREKDRDQHRVDSERRDQERQEERFREVERAEERERELSREVERTEKDLALKRELDAEREKMQQYMEKLGNAKARLLPFPAP